MVFYRHYNVPKGKGGAAREVPVGLDRVFVINPLKMWTNSVQMGGLES